MNTDQYREYFRNEVIPKNYSPYFHVTLNFGLLILSGLFCLTRTHELTTLDLTTIPIMLIIGNFTVYFIHRFPLHKRMPFLCSHTYDIHTKQHHRFYTNTHYQFDSPKDFYILFFPTWTVISFTLIALPALYFISLAIFTTNQTWLILFSACLYFLLYESIHFISHLHPKNKLLKLTFFKYMWKHHRLHHNPKYMNEFNFNIVYPLADKLIGTSKGHNNG